MERSSAESPQPFGFGELISWSYAIFRDSHDARQAKRRTKARAMSATSRQLLSMVSACPRPGISTYSVTPPLRFCLL
jgi:hypothetical protein